MKSVVLSHLPDHISSTYMIIDACSYCYGPASTISTILDIINVNKQFAVIFIGTGSSLEFLRNHPIIDYIIEVNTESFSALEQIKELISSSSLVFVNTNPVLAIYAKQLKVPVVYLDILPWMNSSVEALVTSISALYHNKQKLKEIPNACDLLASVEKYVMQSYLGNFPIDPLIKNPVIVGPLLERQMMNEPAVRSNKKSRLLISTGGLFNPDTEDDILIEYARCIAELGWKTAHAMHLDEVLVCGPDKLQNFIHPKDKSHGTSLAVTRLPHSTFIEEVRNSEFIAIVPGLTSIYETFAIGNPTLLLPSTNYSQVLQTRAVLDSGLAGDLVITEKFNEIYRATTENGEIEGTKQLLNLLTEQLMDQSFHEYVRSGFERLLNTGENDALIRKRQAYVNALGHDGPGEVARHVLDVIQDANIQINIVRD